MRTLNLLAAAAVVALFGCSDPEPAPPPPSESLEFRNLRVVDVRGDNETGSTRVRVGFEVFRVVKIGSKVLKEENVPGLGISHFAAFEDDRRATSESLSVTKSEDVRVPITLLLDTSSSMYASGAVGDLKKAALTFVEQLQREEYRVSVRRFSRTVSDIGSIDDIPDTNEGLPGGDRWTSLYFAVDSALEDNKEAIIVVFSDGADNYSQNHGVDSLETVSSSIGDRVVHAIGFGNLEHEADLMGVSAKNALERLSRNGSFSEARTTQDFGQVFSDIARRLRSLYVFDYYSPHLAGRHSLQIEVCREGLCTRTKPISFNGLALGARDAAAPRVVSDAAPQAPWAPPATRGSTFRERLSSGGEGPEMVVIPAGRFDMGCLSNDTDCYGNEKPVHRVTIPQPFAVSVHEVTFEDYDRFTHPNRVGDEGWGRGTRPVINVSWNDAREYVDWLSAQTGGTYRLLSEAEWEYAARAGSTTKYSWGDAIGTNRANCGNEDCGDRFENTASVGSFRANAFGLYDMHGNVWEWVEDCWNASYTGAPMDGSPWRRGDCASRVVRGGSWGSVPRVLRSASRVWSSAGNRSYGIGFRVARTLSP